MAKLSDFIDQGVIDDYLENDPDILAGKLELAADAVEYAQSIAPVDDGDYRDGIKARRYGKTGVGIVFEAEHSNLVEYGSIHNEEHAVMRRTIEHFGGAG